MQANGGSDSHASVRWRVLLACLTVNEAGVFAMAALKLGLRPAVGSEASDVAQFAQTHAGAFPLLAIVGENAGFSVCGVIRLRVPSARIVYLCDGHSHDLERAAVGAGADIAYGCDERARHALDELEAFAKQGKWGGQKHVGPLMIDERTETVALQGRRLELTRNEYALLAELINNYPGITSKARAKAACSMPEHGGARNAEWHVRNLRAKMNPDDPRNCMVRVKWGQGWYLDPNWLPSERRKPRSRARHLRQRSRSRATVENGRNPGR
jgi:DNA-binding response OmpR family regulator